MSNPASPPEGNEVEIRLFAMRRSGSHALLNWICSLFEGPACFINDITRHHPGNPQCASGDLPALPAARRVSLGEPKRLLLYNFEDVPLPRRANWWLPENLAGSSKHRHTILLLRDPYNLFASRLRAAEERPKNPLMRSMFPTEPGKLLALRDLWLQYAREYLGETFWLPAHALLVSYTDWVGNPECRAQLAAELGGKDTDAAINQIPKYGFGSSFDGPARHEVKDRDSLLRRWRHYAGNPLYEDFVSHPGFRRLSRQIFGDVRA